MSAPKWTEETRKQGEAAIARIEDWAGADHFEDCPALPHTCGECSCEEDACDEGEGVCDCYLGAMRTLQMVAKLALAEINRLSAELEQLSKSADGLVTETQRLQGIEQRAEAAEANAERERARVDDHDSARQSEKERADYAEAKLAEAQADADLISRLVDEAVAGDRENRCEGCGDLCGHVRDEAVAEAVAEERKALRAYVARLLDVRPYRDSVLAALDAQEREKEK